MFKVNDKVIVKADAWKNIFKRYLNIRKFSDNEYKLLKDSLTFTIINKVKSIEFPENRCHCVTKDPFHFSVSLFESELLRAP